MYKQFILKKLFPFLLIFVTCQYLYGYSDEIYHELIHAWSLHGNEKYEEAIEICTNLLKNKKIEKVDKMHVLIARSMFYISINQADKCNKDIKEVINIKSSDPECAHEFLLYYH